MTNRCNDGRINFLPDNKENLYCVHIPPPPRAYVNKNKAFSLKEISDFAFLIISSIRLIPHLLILNLHKNRNTIFCDIQRWVKELNLEKPQIRGTITAFLFLMTNHQSYRNLFYYRVGLYGEFIKFLCRPMNTLFVGGNTIGGGLMLWHAFSTIINVESIGKDCAIWQQVTIGKGNNDKVPTIGNNVSIFAGAIIIGGISIGDNVKIGAGAVVTKNIPENCTVVGCPAYIVKRDGIKIKEAL